MLTQEMIFALLQGLPAAHLDHLDRPWYLLAVRIERALKEGLDPYAALRSAFSNSPEWERRVFLRAYLQEEPVLALTDLTPRQKDALIALRAAGACSLPQLSRVLVLDRSYTRRLLEVLIEKGYAVKYFRRDGTYYLAISSPLNHQTKTDITGLMQAFKQALFASQDSPPNATSPNNSQIRNQQSAIINSSPSPQAVDVPHLAKPKGAALRSSLGSDEGNSNATGAFPVASESRLSRVSRESRESPKSPSSVRSHLSRKSSPRTPANGGRLPRPP